MYLYQNKREVTRERRHSRAGTPLTLVQVTVEFDSTEGDFLVNTCGLRR